MTTMVDLAALVDERTDAFYGIAAAYEILIGGVPNIGGFTYLINAMPESAGGIVFNQENVLINSFNSLVQGNAQASAMFDALIAGHDTLTEQIEAMYTLIVSSEWRTDEGLAWLTRPEALDFYEQGAIDRGITHENGAAVVALSCIVNAQIAEDQGIGDVLNDLRAAIDDGSAELPENGFIFTPAGVADGWNYDSSDPETWEPSPLIGISSTNGDIIA